MRMTRCHVDLPLRVGDEPVLPERAASHLARVLRRGGQLFHYTGMPNRLTSGRDVPREVATRLARAGFRARPELDGVFAVRN